MRLNNYQRMASCSGCMHKLTQSKHTCFAQANFLPFTELERTKFQFVSHLREQEAVKRQEKQSYCKKKLKWPSRPTSWICQYFMHTWASWSIYFICNSINSGGHSRRAISVHRFPVFSSPHQYLFIIEWQ